MQLLELPLDVFRIVITFTVRELGLKQSMKARLTCRTFADEILTAVITTRTIEDVTERFARLFNINYHHDVIARYLYHRLRTDGPVAHAWITTMRHTSQTLAQHDPAGLELLERSACLCLAVNAGSSVFEVLSGEQPDRRAQLEEEGGGSIWANCLTLAAWVGDMALVESLTRGSDSDPPSFFGRPSWAAAVQGHRDVLLFLLDRAGGALPYEPTFVEGPNFELAKSPLAAAAYMGHEGVVRLYLQPQRYRAEMAPEETTAISYAAQGNRPDILKILLEHYRARSAPQEFTRAIDSALVWSCRRGAYLAAQTLLDYGADADETDQAPRSCLQLAAIAGNAPLVKTLLDAGAALEAPDAIRNRSTGRLRQRRRQKDALTEAYLRDYTAIIQLIEEKQVEIYRSF